MHKIDNTHYNDAGMWARCYLCLYSTKKHKVKNAVKPVVQRPAKKQLQNENTDAVWKELTYLQQENKTLKAEKY